MSKINPSQVIIDLETTGADATRDRITEIGLLRIEAGQVVDRWQTLVNPGCAIPPEIQALTGINNDMVRHAPRFADVMEQLLGYLQGAVFVAHNARFDYGFIKNALSREQQSFTADVLCTVRLSRRLAPEFPSHSLDSLVQRHALAAQGRHRAMGDAQLVYELLQKLQALHGIEQVEQAIKYILKIPSLPPHLPGNAMENIPDCPGVYLFYGVNDLPLYIGKSVNLRDRVRSHFSSDYRQANDARLSQEMRRLEWQTCASEFEALLLETVLIRERLPLLNKAKRRVESPVMLRFSQADSTPTVIKISDLSAPELAGHYGPFSNAASARRSLQSIASKSALCWSTLGLEKRDGPCFARQIRKCAGCCVGIESNETHRLRVIDALEPLRIPEWPFASVAILREPGSHPYRFEHWCLKGEADQDQFDSNIYKLLRKQLDSLAPIEVNADQNFAIVQ